MYLSQILQNIISVINVFTKFTFKLMFMHPLVAAIPTHHTFPAWLEVHSPVTTLILWAVECCSQGKINGNHLLARKVTSRQLKYIGNILSIPHIVRSVIFLRIYTSYKHCNAFQCFNLPIKKAICNREKFIVQGRM